MKKLLLSVLLIGLISCTNDDCEFELTLPSEPQICVGDAWIRCDGGIREVVKGIQYNCETNQPINSFPEGCEFLGWDNPDTP